jgi:hypothetical protein
MGRAGDRAYQRGYEQIGPAAQKCPLSVAQRGKVWREMRKGAVAWYGSEVRAVREYKTHPKVIL